MTQKIDLEKDQLLRFELSSKYEEWERTEVIDLLHSLNVSRFRYIISIQKRERLPLIYRLSPQRLRDRILLHLESKEQQWLLEEIDKAYVEDFYHDENEKRRFLILFEFEINLA